MICTWLWFFFDEIKSEQNSNSITSFQDNVGYAFIGIIWLVIIVNILYLVPMKMYEIYILFKKIFVTTLSKLKLLFKNKPKVIKQNIHGSMYSGDPTINSASPMERSSIQIQPKLFQMHQERKNRKAKQELDKSFSKNSQTTQLETIEEEKYSSKLIIILNINNKCKNCKLLSFISFYLNYYFR